MKKILVIDDDELFLETLERLLASHGFQVSTARSGMEAIELVRRDCFDLIISDVRMPEMDGIETLKKIKEQDPRSRSIVMTGYASDTAAIQALKLGADDYINKPFHLDEFLESVRRSLERYEKEMGATVSTSQMQKKYHELIENIINSVEKSHIHFHRHAQGVAELAVRVGSAMGLADERLELLRLAGSLHDIGMFGIKESVLQKREALAEKETLLIKDTPLVAREMLKEIEGLRPVLPVIFHLHERFDGTGYPDGIRGDEIPLESRILAVAEAFVSLTSPRSYRDRKEPPEALEIIEREKASRFDPAVVDVLMTVTKAETPEAPEIRKDRSLHALLALGWLYFSAGKYTLSEAAVNKMLEADSPDPAVAVQARILKSKTEMACSGLEAALETAQEALKLAKKYDDQLLSARAFSHLGVVWRESGKLSEAEISLKKARQIYEKWGDELELTRSDLHLALLYGKAARAGSPEEARYRDTLTEALGRVVAAGTESILLDEGTEFLPLLYSALEWNADQAGPMLKELFRRYPDEVIGLLLKGREAHQLFLIDMVPGLGGKKARETLETLAHSPIEAIKLAAGQSLGRLSREEKPLLEIHQFGHFSLFLGGREVDDSLWQTKHARHMFIYLALNAGKAASEEKLMDMFWRDSPQEKAKQNMQTTLTRIRNVFRKHFAEVELQEFVVKSGEFLKFNTGTNYWSDVEEFERSLEKGAACESSGNTKQAMVEYRKAEHLYKGALLEGIYEDWCIRKREELQEKFLDALARLSAYHLERGSHEAALNYARAILEEDAFNSRGMTCLMKSLSVSGKRDAAVKRYHQYCRQIEKELSLPPDPEVAKTYYGIIDGKV